MIVIERLSSIFKLEFPVVVAPYDVRQGNFTGASVNAVTRSGTNEFSASVYTFFRDQSMVGKKISGVDQTQSDFKFSNTGVRVAGPIIKNRLFFFANFETESNIQPATTFVPNAGQGGNNVSALTQNDINTITNLMQSKYGYNVGPVNFNKDFSASNKFLIKLDFNINSKHKLSLKYNFLEAHADKDPSGVGASATVLPFQSVYYRQNNKMHSFIAELNSRLNNNFSNALQIGYTALRDPRGSFSGGDVNNPVDFPQVIIQNGSNASYTSFGYEQFTYGNTINQDFFQFSDNLTFFKGDHVITGGISAEYIHCYNYFLKNRNVYTYNSVTDFVNDVNNPGSTTGPKAYTLTYPAAGDISYKFDALTLGFYAQDEFTGIKNLKLTGGLRVDVPIFLTTLQSNPAVSAMTFNNGEKIDVGKLPNTTPLFSPRVGFNWDVFGDKKTQVRGGSGLFTGRIPYVYIGNQAGQNGLLTGQILATGSNGASLPAYHFNPNYLAYAPNGGAASATYELNAVVNNFKFPQVWRTNIAVDQKLIYDIVGTLEFLYTKDINAIYYRQANLVDPTVNSNVINDGRPLLPFGGLDRNINQAVTQALVLDNTSKGYQWSITAQLQKAFASGLFASIAYTYTDARDIQSTGTGTTAAPIFYNNAFVGNPNNPALSYSSSVVPNKIVANVSYRKEYLKNFASTFSFIYQGYNYASLGSNSGASRYSMTYSGDPVGNGVLNTSGGNPNLIYIPKSKDEIVLVPNANTTNGIRDTRTPDQLWDQLNAYINQDSYLSAHRGEYAARNGVVAPMYNLLNFRFLQDFYINVGKTTTQDDAGYSYKGKRNNIQFSFEMVNVLNFLNSNWGVLKQPYTTTPLNFVGYEQPAVLNSSGATISQPAGRPIYSFPLVQDPNNGNNYIPLSTTYRDNVGLDSRYQIQIGLRYSFN
jgi:hypothetical protein